MTTLLTKKRR